LFDTIAAISTPLGFSGIGIVRVSGPLCIEIAEAIFRPSKTSHPLASHRLFYGQIVDPSGNQTIDEALVVYMRAPITYTREDCLEVQAHGGMAVLQEILRLVIDHGARLAQPGEFTLRAFLNGRIDLTQAEAVVDVVQARSQTSLRLAQRQLHGGLSSELHKVKEDLLESLTILEAQIDFPEEMIPEIDMTTLMETLTRTETALSNLISSFAKGRLCKDGASIMILGAPNAGKSTLFNALLGFERAIVTPIPGTTRDMVEEWMEWEGMPIRAIDTAGLRESQDTIEEHGHRLLFERIRQIDLIIWILDSSLPPEPLAPGLDGLIQDTPCVVALNKVDLPRRLFIDDIPSFLKSYPKAEISGKEGTGIEELVHLVKDQLLGASVPEGLLLTSARHKLLLQRALEHILEAKKSLGETRYVELAAADLHEALRTVQEIVGETINDDILSRIFGKFCIGK
jgi:tRNA modification GTPase